MLFQLLQDHYQALQIHSFKYTAPSYAEKSRNLLFHASCTREARYSCIFECVEGACIYAECVFACLYVRGQVTGEVLLRVEVEGRRDEDSDARVGGVDLSNQQKWVRPPKSCFRTRTCLKLMHAHLIIFRS